MPSSAQYMPLPMQIQRKAAATCMEFESKVELGNTERHASIERCHSTEISNVGCVIVESTVLWGSSSSRLFQSLGVVVNTIDHPPPLPSPGGEEGISGLCILHVHVLDNWRTATGGSRGAQPRLGAGGCYAPYLRRRIRAMVMAAVASTAVSAEAWEPSVKRASASGRGSGGEGVDQQVEGVLLLLRYFRASPIDGRAPPLHRRPSSPTAGKAPEEMFSRLRGSRASACQRTHKALKTSNCTLASISNNTKVRTGPPYIAQLTS